jgi:hypothetical protein
MELLEVQKLRSWYQIATFDKFWFYLTRDSERNG